MLAAVLHYFLDLVSFVFFLDFLQVLLNPVLCSSKRWDRNGFSGVCLCPGSLDVSSVPVSLETIRHLAILVTVKFACV